MTTTIKSTGKHTIINVGFLVIIWLTNLVITSPAHAQIGTGSESQYLGRYSSNPFDSESISNPFGQYGSPFSPNSVNNPFGRYGSPFSPDGARNPFTNGGARLFGEDGTYLGKLNKNQFDSESISNPYGQYGSPFSPNSVNNPYGRYGSPFSPEGITNPYSVRAPIIVGPPDIR